MIIAQIWTTNASTLRRQQRATGMSIAKMMVEAAAQPGLESIMDEHSPMQLAPFSPETLPRQIWELPVSPANALEESVIVAVCVPCP